MDTHRIQYVQPWLRSRTSSVPSGLAIAGEGKGFPPKDSPVARRRFLGLYGIRTGLSSCLDGVLTWGSTNCIALCL